MIGDMAEYPLDYLPSTDYTRRDQVDNTLLEKKEKGTVTKFYDYVEIIPSVIVEKETGYVEHVPGFPTVCYCKPENREQLKSKILERFWIELDNME